MCTAIEDMRNEVAREVAREVTKKNTVLNLKAIMDSLKLTAEQAMDAMRIAPEDREELLCALG